ncbi:Ribosome biogenesis protein Nop16 [Aphelenchoides avenae]|nr:Ribosome biogenesis protein Nop16 [Aphelenchus avenae]
MPRSVKHGRKKRTPARQRTTAAKNKNKRIKKKSKALTTSTTVNAAWDSSKSTKANLEEMGLSYDPNKTIPLPKKAAPHQMDVDEVEIASLPNAKVLGSVKKQKATEASKDQKGVVVQLEKEAEEATKQQKKGRQHKLLQRDIQLCLELIERHGEDYEAIFREPANPLAKLYVPRYERDVPDDLEQLIEEEFDAFAQTSYLNEFNKFNVGLRDRVEPRTYGTQLQKAHVTFELPTRMTISDTTDLRKRFPNLASLISQRHWPDNRLADIQRVIWHQRRLRNAVVRTDQILDEDLQKIVLSEDAKRFVLQREFIKSTHGTYIVASPLIWALTFGAASMSAVRLIAKSTKHKIPGIVLRFSVALVIYYGVATGVYERYELSFDRATCARGEKYVKGCQDYLESSMALGRIVRERMPLTDEKLFTANGDYTPSPALFSTRLDQIKQLLKEASPQPQRRNLRKL